MKKLLIIGKVWPEPNSSAAGGRMTDLIQLFQKNHYRISFASAAAPSEFMADLSKLNIQRQQIEINSTSFDAYVKNLQPDVVLFDRFTTEEQFGWRVAEHVPDALRVLDTEDLHGLRAARHIALKENKKFELSHLQHEVVFRELAAIYRCDLSLIISQFEMDLLLNHFKIPSDLLFYLPFLAEKITEEKRKSWLTLSQKNHFVSIGNFLHEPNWDAVQYLKKDIWPLIRKKLPQTEMHVYGAYPSQKVFELNDNTTGFLVKGRAVSSTEVLSNARVCVAPLRFGAGLKGKLFEAMLCGTPSVTTHIGAEGLNGALPWAGEIAESPLEIAEAAVNLYCNEKKWKEAQGKGIHITNSRFEKDHFESVFIDKIKNAQTSLSQRRLHNFTGAMLRQQTAQGTKYMAMYIEAKNKLKQKS